MDFEDLDAISLSELIGKREITPRELVTSTIDRIEARNPAVNAVIHKLYDAPWRWPTIRSWRRRPCVASQP